MNEQEKNMLRSWCKEMVTWNAPESINCESAVIKQIAQLALQQLEPKVIHPPLRWHEDGREKLTVHVDRQWEYRARQAGLTIGERQ